MRSSFKASMIVLAITTAAAAGVVAGRSSWFAPPSTQKAGMSTNAGPDHAMGKSEAAGDAKDGDAKHIKYYRNPMGLPDTSPTPKKDNMGMDYLPVYDGEDGDDGSVKFSPGKVQKTGVRSEPVEMRTLSVPVRAPATVKEDERRRAVVSLRFEGFIDAVENVTTGSHVKKGEPLMRIYGSGLSSAAAEYLATLSSRASGAVTDQAVKGARRRLENLGAPDSLLPRSSAITRYRRRSSGRRRRTARSLNAPPSTECAPLQATCCSAFPITAWSGCSPTSPSVT